MLIPEIPDYEIAELLGEGACGQVYLGRDKNGQAFAIKVFEVMSVNRVILAESHERLQVAQWPAGVLPLVAAEYRARPSYQISPLAADAVGDGWRPRSLQHRLEDFPGDSSWEVVQKVLTALAQLHEAQVVHGNLKPGNVFLEPDGSVRLADWSLGNMPEIGHLDYTDALLYQPPEQLRQPEGYFREKGYRWDVFTFGVLAYRLITGHFPRCTETFEKVSPASGETRKEHIAADFSRVARSLENQPDFTWPEPAATDLERKYREILDQCLHLDPARRPANALVVKYQFDQIAQKMLADSHIESLLDQARRSRRMAWRSSLAAVACGVAVVVLSSLWQSATLQRNQLMAQKSEQQMLLERRVTDAREKEAATSGEVVDARNELEHERDVWISRVKASRSIGDHLFVWAMEKGNRRLPPIDGRELRLQRLEKYFQDFITRTAEIHALTEERSRAKLQLAEVTLAKGDAAMGAQRLEEAMSTISDLPSDADLDLRIATDRLLLALLLQEQASPAAGEAFTKAREALQKVPQGDVDADRVTELIAVLDFHESRLLAAQGKDGEALECLHKATISLNRLIELRPDTPVLRSELLNCFLASATILDGIGQMGDAREVRSLAAEQLVELIRKDPNDLDLRVELAGCYSGIAEASMLSGDIAVAEARANAALKLLEEIIRLQPGDPDARSLMAAQKGLLAGIYRDRGEAKKAAEFLESGLQLLEDIAVGEGADPVAKYRQALLRWQKGRMLGSQGQRAEEIALEQKAAESLRNLLESGYGVSHAEQIRRSLGYVLGDLGHASQLLADKAAAQKIFAEAVSVWESLYRERPHSEEYEEGLSWSKQRLQDLH
jgi:eukaryotic-like serine/threonine-protein kinase